MFRRISILAICLGLLPAAAHAQAPAVKPGTWTVMIGAEGRITPLWQGAKDNYIFFPTPFLDIRNAGTPEPLYGARDGFGVALFSQGGLRIGPTAKFRLPRREDKDYNNLHGLGDVGTAYEVGVFVDYYWPGRWLRMRAEVRQGWGGHDGIVADLTADFIAHVTPKLQLSGGPRITFASTRATAPYFSVTAAQAGSGLPLYDAKGGVRSYGAGAQARYLWNPQWGTHVFVEYERLAGDAKNSPLVTMRGSADQWTFGFGVTYAFNMKAWW